MSRGISLMTASSTFLSHGILVAMDVRDMTPIYTSEIVVHIPNIPLTHDLKRGTGAMGCTPTVLATCESNIVICRDAASKECSVRGLTCRNHCFPTFLSPSMQHKACIILHIFKWSDDKRYKACVLVLTTRGSLSLHEIISKI